MSKANVDSLITSIIAYVVENNSSNKSIQAQVVGLMGAELPLIVRQLSSGSALAGVASEFKAIEPEIVQVLNGVVDKAPSLSARNNAVSDFVKRINRAFSGEAKKQADVLAQTTPSGTLTYPVMGRSIKDKVATVSWSAHTLDYSQQLGKDGKIKPEAKIVKATGKGESPKASDTVVNEPKTMADLVATTYQYCAKLGIDPIDFAIAFELACKPASGKRNGKRSINSAA